MKDFGHDQASKYSCLVFDNRGIGESDKPLTRYSTSEMAKDTFEILNHLGWTSERQLHVIGISMGGMIAQEMVGLECARNGLSTKSSSANEHQGYVGAFQDSFSFFNFDSRTSHQYSG